MTLKELITVLSGIKNRDNYNVYLVTLSAPFKDYYSVHVSDISINPIREEIYLVAEESNTKGSNTMDEKKECDHVWRHVNEQGIFNSFYPVGWECKKCNMFVSDGMGMKGTVSPEEVLIGVHGGLIVTATGKKCRRQVYNKDTGELTYE